MYSWGGSTCTRLILVELSNRKALAENRWHKMFANQTCNTQKLRKFSYWGRDYCGNLMVNSYLVIKYYNKLMWILIQNAHQFEKFSHVHANGGKTNSQKTIINTFIVKTFVQCVCLTYLKPEKNFFCSNKSMYHWFLSTMYGHFDDFDDIFIVTKFLTVWGSHQRMLETNLLIYGNVWSWLLYLMSPLGWPM